LNTLAQRDSIEYQNLFIAAKLALAGEALELQQSRNEKKECHLTRSQWNKKREIFVLLWNVSLCL